MRIAGGKLDSVNYATARGAHLMKQIVSEHHSGADYHDQTISVAELRLKKKVYNKANSSKKLMRIVCIKCVNLCSKLSFKFCMMNCT